MYNQINYRIGYERGITPPIFVWLLPAVGQRYKSCGQAVALVL